MFKHPFFTFQLSDIQYYNFFGKIRLLRYAISWLRLPGVLTSNIQPVGKLENDRAILWPTDKEHLSIFE